MLKSQDSTRIRRQDVTLDVHALNSFLRGMAANGVSLSEVVMGLELFAEANGTIVAECRLDGGKSFDFRVFQPHEWEISDSAGDLTRKVLESIRPKPPVRGVFDIFTGKAIERTAQ